MMHSRVSAVLAAMALMLSACGSPTPAPTPTTSPKPTPTTVSTPCEVEILRHDSSAYRVDTNCDGRADYQCDVYNNAGVVLVGATLSRVCQFEYRTLTFADAQRAYDLQNGLGSKYNVVVSEPVKRGSIWIVPWTEPGWVR